MTMMLAARFLNVLPLIQRGVDSFTSKKPHAIVEGRNEPLQEWEVSCIWKKKLLSNKSRTD
ncbi:hypothetical protein EGW74_04280 [Enterococcus casseliflavus]|nr:hypothetical protein EGW74_04280 [Enterococcus casseliflavus]